MFWLICGFIIWVIFTISFCCNCWYDLSEKIFLSITFAMITILIALLGLLMTSSIATGCVEIDYNISSDTKIIALKDNQNVNGNFYIFGGYVNEELYYYYAKETEFGYKTDKIPANDVYIKYTESDPHIEEYTGTFKNDIVSFFAVPLNCYRYVIYCPENTITTEFNVDLE